MSSYSSQSSDFTYESSNSVMVIYDHQLQPRTVTNCSDSFPNVTEKFCLFPLRTLNPKIVSTTVGPREIYYNL